MTNEQRREHVIAMYAGPRWRKKVLNMSDGQVFAIYNKQQLKLEKEMLEKRKQKTDVPENPSDEIPF